MVYMIDLTPAEEKRVAAAARQAGIEPTELIKRVALAHLSEPRAEIGRELDVQLREWQQIDRTDLTPVISTQSLVAQWLEENAHISDSERQAEERLWEVIERELLGSRGSVTLRRIG